MVHIRYTHLHTAKHIDIVQNLVCVSVCFPSYLFTFSFPPRSSPPLSACPLSVTVIWRAGSWHTGVFCQSKWLSGWRWRAASEWRAGGLRCDPWAVIGWEIDGRTDRPLRAGSLVVTVLMRVPQRVPERLERQKWTLPRWKRWQVCDYTLLKPRPHLITKAGPLTRVGRVSH